MAIILAGTTAQSVATLANVLFAAFDSTTIQTNNGPPWPFSPDSLDFSQVGDIAISVAAPTAKVTFSFKSGSPTLSGTLDLAKLEALLSSAPNVLDYESPSDQGPSATVMLTTPGFTRQKSGVVFLTAEFDGTQSAQAIVSVALYRDYGLPGQVDLAVWHVAPGGLVAFNWSGHIHDTDTLPDNSPHTYTFIATGSASNLSLAKGAGEIIVFELGGPG